MQRSGMPRPTSCLLSTDTKRFKDNKSNEETEPPPDTNLLLAVVGLHLSSLAFFSIFCLPLIYRTYVVNCERSPTPFVLSIFFYQRLCRRNEIESPCCKNETQFFK